LNMFRDVPPDGIYMTTGLGTAGLNKALRECDPEGKTCVILSDLEPASQDMLESGRAEFAICQNPEEEGYQALKIMMDHLVKGELPKTGEHLTRIEIITRENM